ncbi:MAG: AAA domain-containing protein [Lachnospiraceae bacterium]|nr:AAA domain-containing protein [Lachnospiraceae bacterium]
MNIREAKEELKRTILAYTARTENGTYRIPTVRQRPVLLMGPPGIGKTAVMEQVARECGLGLVAYTMTHHTRQSAMGLPTMEKKTFGGREYVVTDYTMSEILASVYEQMEQTGKKEGILFLDEINCVSETLMPALLQFLQYKTFGNHKLPEGWIVMAAGNPVRYNQSVRELDTATIDRVKWMEIAPDLSVWQSYAANEGIHPAICSFLNWKPESFYGVQAELGGRGFVTARGWEDLSRILLTLEELGLAVTEELPGQYLHHREIAGEFWIYYRLYQACQERPYEKMAGAPYDERLCMLQMLLQGVYRRAEEWQQAGELFQSLEYFFQGCKRQDETRKKTSAPDPFVFLELCGEQLENRRRGIQVKKECGLLSSKEEEREALLEREVQRQLGVWRLEASKEKEGRAARSIEEGYPLVLQEWMQRQEQQEEKLEALLLEYADFMEQSFGGRQEQYLFSLGLMEHQGAATFLKKRLPDLYTSFDQGRDLNLEKDRLQECLQK